MGARETILRRRALFIASALQGIAMRDAVAQDAEEHQELPPPPPPEHPHVCLTPPLPSDRPNHDGIDLAMGCAPSVLAPAFTNGAVGFAAPLHLGLRRDLTKSFDLALVATVMPSHARDAFAPVGGMLRLGTTAITPDGWYGPYRLFNTIDVGGGAWLAPERAGPNADEAVPTRGAFLSLGATFLGLRYSWDEASFGRGGHFTTYQKRIDVSLPLAFFFTSQRTATEERIGPSWFTIGVNVTFYLQIKKPTADIDAHMAER